MADFTPTHFNQIFDQLSRQDFPQGALYIIATPIGNLADITFRATYSLNLVDGIACEDTRHSQVLLNQLGIQKPLLAVHEHNEREASENLVKLLQEGQRWAYISDAGTPGISDPGGKLVQTCLTHGIRVIPIPGPSAISTLASVAGAALDQGRGLFQFLGFAPIKGKEQTEFFDRIEHTSLGSIFYETPQRIEKTLELLQTSISDQQRKVVIGRELTKKFETITHLAIAELSNWIKSNEQLRGEFVILVSGAVTNIQSQSIDHKILELANQLSAMLGSKQIAEVLANHFEISKKDAYQIALNAKKGLDD